MNIETPCVFIDLDIVEKNIERMAKIASKNGVRLRPHIKTHKIPELAKMQVNAGAEGITAAKISEAEVMAAEGMKDIFIAYPIVGESKIKRLLELHDKIRLIAAVDNIHSAQALSEAALLTGRQIEVRLEVDTGMRRTGVPYNEAIELAKKLTGLKGLKLTGIFTFRGLIYKDNATDNRREAGLEEGSLMSGLASKLKKEGIDIRDVSVGSTPTSEFAAQVEGVTEIRPGTYIFNDVMTCNTASASYDDCAAKVCVTVVSRPSPHLAVIDGGSKAFAADVAPGKFPYNLDGYGRIEDSEYLTLERLSEEHGMIKIKEGAGDLDIGQKLMIIPNHICTAMNLFDKVYFVKGGKMIREVSVKGRGKVY